MAEPDLAALRRRRGTFRSSITRMSGKVEALVTGEPLNPKSKNFAQQYIKKLESYDSEFKIHHMAIVDMTTDVEQLAREQELLDKIEEDMIALIVKLEALLNPTTQHRQLSLIVASWNVVLIS